MDWVFLKNNEANRDVLTRTITEIEAIDQRIFIGTETGAYVLHTKSNRIEEIVENENEVSPLQADGVSTFC